MTEQQWLETNKPWDMLEFLGDRAGERKLRLFLAGCCRRAARWLPDQRARQAFEAVERHADGRASAQQLHAVREVARSAHRDAAQRWKNVSSAWAKAIERRDFAGANGTEKDEIKAAELAALAVYEATDQSAAWGRRGVLDPAAGAVAFAAGGAADRIYGCAGDLASRRYAETKQQEHQAQAQLLRDLFGPADLDRVFGPSPLRAVRLEKGWLRYDGGLIRRMAADIHEHHGFGDLPILADALEDAGCSADAVLDHCRAGAAHARGCWVLDWILAGA